MAARPVVLSVLSICALAACGGSQESRAEATVDTSGGEYAVADNTNAPPPAALEGVAEAPTAGYPGRTGSGRTPDDPVSACGPRDSYAFVAGEFQCPGGGNPLGGDPMAGAQARVGNVGENAARHIIDLYQVPCPSGTVDVYVDMYGCPEMQGALGE